MIRLNIGCGEFRAEGWVNTDLHDKPPRKPDIICSALSLPFADSSCSHVYCGHVLEHLDLDEELPKALTEIQRVLEPDGELLVVGPDYKRAKQSFPHEIPNILNGKGRWPGDAHKWACHEQRQREALEKAGLTVYPQDINKVSDFWPLVSRIGWQFALLCRQ